MQLATEFRVYVGTYGKYAAGSIAGQWLDLSEYADYEDFHAKCLEIHADESDPEFMYQDHEGIPGQLISESWISPEVWEWVEMSETDREITVAYMCLTDYTFAELGGVWGAWRQALDSHMGQYESEADAAEQMTSECFLRGLPSWIVIDWDATWGNQLGQNYLSGMINGELWVFNNR